MAARRGRRPRPPGGVGFLQRAAQGLRDGSTGPQQGTPDGRAWPLIMPRGVPGLDPSTPQAHPVSRASSSPTETLKGQQHFRGHPLCPEQNGIPGDSQMARAGRGPWQSTQVFSAISLERDSSQLTQTPRQVLGSGVGPVKDWATSSSGSL